MPGEDFLFTIAQVAIALAGFAGLISVFRSGEDSGTQSEFYGQSMMLELSLGAAFFALLPMPLFYTLGAEPDVWRVTSALLLAFLLAWIVLDARRGVRVQDHPLVVRVSQTLALIAVVLIQIGNIVVWRGLAGYAWGLLWMLLASGTQFMLFIYNYAHTRPSRQ
jgi:hypothetical protein